MGCFASRDRVRAATFEFGERSKPAVRSARPARCATPLPPQTADAHSRSSACRWWRQWRRRWSAPATRLTSSG
eukprot:scaffold24729_cov117-Isochrysis_galbana.AAC.2